MSTPDRHLPPRYASEAETLRLRETLNRMRDRFRDRCNPLGIAEQPADGSESLDEWRRRRESR